MDPAAVKAARDKLKAKFGDSATTQVGGKGSVRRKTKVVHKPAALDDKRLQGTLKRLGITPIPGIEDVTITLADNSTINFASPKVQAAISANTYVVTGTVSTKAASAPGGGGFGAAPPPYRAAPAPKIVPAGEDEDDEEAEMPELDSTDFEATAKKGKA